MLAVIIRKEIHDNLLNARFIVACVISVVLIISSIVVLTNNYKEELQDYRNRVTTQNEFINEFGHSNRATWMARVFREPSRFQPLVSGIDREAFQENFLSNPVPVLFPRLDFVTLVTIIMSLTAILFSYNSISGEREDGLLKQMLSASIARSTILLGKFIGGNISLLTPFTIGVLAGLIYMSIDSVVQIEGIDLGIALLMLLASYAYIAAFYGLGLLFSARSLTSNASVLKSLFVWVILVLALPNISPFIAARVYRIPSVTKIEQDVYRITSDERDQILGKRRRALLQTKFSDLVTIFTSMNRAEIGEKTRTDPAFKQRYAEYTKEYDELVRQVNKEQQEQAGKILATFEAQSKFQEKLATVFASVSPFSNFIFVATDLTELGIEGENRWEKQGNEYEKRLQEYVEAQYTMEKAKNPAFGYNDYLDLRDRPQFQYQPRSVAERVSSAFPQFGLLVLFNLLFLVGAFVSFLKYDAR